ncbi:MAG TPA: DUF190 domain-containing protein [Oscillatoriaceae cyanobacterium]
MPTAGPAQLLTVYLHEHDHYHHEPLHLVLLDRAHRAKLAGITVLRGVAGFGKAGHVHAGLNEVLQADLPLVVQIVDSEEAIAAFLPTVRELAPSKLVTLSPVVIP